MSAIKIRCPAAGQPYSIGVDIDGHSFRSLQAMAFTARCPHCMTDHRWSPTEAWLEPPDHTEPGGMLIGLQRRATSFRPDRA